MEVFRNGKDGCLKAEVLSMPESLHAVLGLVGLRVAERIVLGAPADTTSRTFTSDGGPRPRRHAPGRSAR